MLTKIFFLGFKLSQQTQITQFSFLIFWVSIIWRPWSVIYQQVIISANFQLSILDLISSSFDWSNCLLILLSLYEVDLAAINLTLYSFSKLVIF